MSSTTLSVLTQNAEKEIKRLNAQSYYELASNYRERESYEKQ
jgi:hypothetical protein